jgi:tetratricopeptide (TPR) repeat protein
LQCRTANNRFTHPTRTRVFGLADVCPDCASNRYSDDPRGEDDFLLFLANRFEYASQVQVGNPELRWDGVPGVTTYQVQVWDCGQAVYDCTEMLWEAAVEGTAIAYCGEPLMPGRNYELRVMGEQGAESDEAFLMLRRLEEAQAAAISQSIAALEAETLLSGEARQLAVAEQLLAVAAPDTLPPEGVGLVLEAIAALETVAPESETPYLHRLLGDLYLQAGLLTEAQEAYEQTLSLTPRGNDRANRAAAQVGLANIAAAQEDLGAAALWLRQARVSYLLFNDAERAEQVQDWLTQVEALAS